MAKDGLGTVEDRATAHRIWAAKFYANVTPMHQEPRQQWRRRARKALKKQRIMPTDGVNRARISIHVIEERSKLRAFGRVGKDVGHIDRTLRHAWQTDFRGRPRVITIAAERAREDDILRRCAHGVRGA